MKSKRGDIVTIQLSTVRARILMTSSLGVLGFAISGFGSAANAQGAAPAATQAPAQEIVVTGSRIVRRDFYGLGVVRDCIVDIARQSKCGSAIVVGSRVLGCALDDYRTTLDPLLRLLALETVLLIAREYGRSCRCDYDRG